MCLRYALPLATLIFCQAAALAQEPTYQPDVQMFDGQESLSFPTNGALSLTDGGTIEFWVAPSWDEALQYNPVVLSNHGEDGILFEIAIDADKQAFSLVSADQMDSFAHDFGDGSVHHVAIINLDDRVVAIVNGQIAGSSSLSFANLEPRTLDIGSAKDGALPFSGAIGAIRFWDAAIDPETLIEYNWRDVRQDNSDHPYLPFLSGYSEFETQDFVIIDKPVVPTWLADEPSIFGQEIPYE